MKFFRTGWCKKRYCRTIPIELNPLSIYYSRIKNKTANFSSAETAAENALCAEQAKNRVNAQPSLTKAKYGAVNGVCAPFFFSAVVTDRIPQGDAFVSRACREKKKGDCYESMAVFKALP